jgi:threonine dehydrogenase-like Zn-dependent dehydrogenase
MRWHFLRIAADIAKDKFSVCRKAGAHEIVYASKDDVAETLKGLIGGRGMDVAVDYVSSTAMLEAYGYQNPHPEIILDLISKILCSCARISCSNGNNSLFCFVGNLAESF